MKTLYKKLAHTLPRLEDKLKEADMDLTPEDFVKKTIFSALYMAVGITFFSGIIIWKLSMSPLLLLGAPVLFFLLFLYFSRLPDVKSLMKARELDREVIDATRYLIIELESGIPLYESIEGIKNNFEHVGNVFRDLLIDINTGSRMEDAITKAIRFTPSEQLRRVLWQMLNSLETGADVATSLKEMIHQISREQLVQIRSYGRKLNPLAMFYMIIAVIIPSLGVTMVTALSSFTDIQLDLQILIIIACALGFMQFMFLAVIKSSRPAVNM